MFNDYILSTLSFHLKFVGKASEYMTSSHISITDGKSFHYDHLEFLPPYSPCFPYSFSHLMHWEKRQRVPP